MEKTWKPTTAGILNIVSGALGLILGLLLLIGLLVFIIIGGTAFGFIQEIPRWFFPLLLAMLIPSILANILSIVGGVFELQRKMWGLALAASIATFFHSLFLGVAAIIFTVMSKNEFK